MDVHGPYLPTSSAPRKFWTGPNPPKDQAVPACGWAALHERAEAAPPDRARRQEALDAVCRRLVDLYDECLSGLDADLGAFLTELQVAGNLENTWVVITGDHGEHFGEHQQFGHGSSLYNELTHVPLILIPPLGRSESGDDPHGAIRGRRIRNPVSTRNLAATVAELVDPGHDHPFPGSSLARYWTGAGLEPADPILSQLEDPSLRGEDFRTDNVIRVDSLIDEDHVLIDGKNQPLELYHLFNDPRQQYNLAGQPAERTRLERLQAALGTLQPALGRSVEARAH